jgi:hypothetical protein
MDDYADIYYVDTRNADSRDHRRPGSTGSVPWRPVAPPPSRTVLVPGTQMPIAHQAPIVYAQPLPQQQSPFGTLFGRMTPDQAIEMVTQLFAALQPLPAAPVPTRSGDVDSGNLILFQDALAKHAKRDEQVRMVGSLVARLMG